MRKLLLFHQPDCPNCPSAEVLATKLEADGVLVERHNIQTTNGLGEAAFRQVMSTPTLMVEDDEEMEVKRWTGEIKREWWNDVETLVKQSDI